MNYIRRAWAFCVLINFLGILSLTVRLGAVTMIDDLNDFSQVASHSTGLQFDIYNAQALLGDPSRLCRTNTNTDAAEYITYSVPGLQQLSFIALFGTSEEAIVDFKVFSSPDSSVWTQVTDFSTVNQLVNGNSWTRRDYTFATFAAGTNFVKIEFRTGGLHLYNPEISQVVATYTPPANTSLTSIFQDSVGNIGIGTVLPTKKLSVNGAIRAKEIIVDSNWYDIVFSKDYKLRSMAELERDIAELGHLPDIPSEREIKEHGASLGEINGKLLQKIEELTLYVLQIKKESDALSLENKSLKARLESLELDLQSTKNDSR